MCGQGDEEIIPEWKKNYTVDDFKRIAEQQVYSAITVSNADPQSFGHAALKNFDYQLEKEHCKPASGYSCTIYIYKAPPGLKKVKNDG